jgi:hypothetical protein
MDEFWLIKADLRGSRSGIAYRARPTGIGAIATFTPIQNIDGQKIMSRSTNYVAEPS